ncbi:MAG TPA: polyprenyl synthetase family protein [Pyrinomonadaceae bacterium]
MKTNLTTAQNTPGESDVDLMMRFESLRQAWWPSISALIDEVTSVPSQQGSLLRRMVEYHLQSGGKRLRAILPLLIAEALGCDPGRLVPFGAACEVLHNASLIHDDLQDGDTTRRGRPAAWKKFGTAQAINLGDAMIAYSVLLLCRLDVPAERKERIISLTLTEMLRVIDGQVQDLELKDHGEAALADYLQMIEGKTASLFALPMAGAALLCDAPQEVERGLVEAACHIGMLFQIQDDIMDIYGEKGKELPGNDVREGKRSILVVHCLEAAGADDAGWLRGVLDKRRDQTTVEDVAGAKDLFVRSGSLAFALEELARRRKAALQVPALAPYRTLVAVLGRACDMFLQPVSTVVNEYSLAQRH